MHYRTWLTIRYRDNRDAQPLVRLLPKPFAQREVQHEDEQQRGDEQDDRAPRVAEQQPEVFRGEREHGQSLVSQRAAG